MGALRRPSLALLSCQSDWGREERPTLTPLLLLVCMPRILSETEYRGRGLGVSNVWDSGWFSAVLKQKNPVTAFLN